MHMKIKSFPFRIGIKAWLGFGALFSLAIMAHAQEPLLPNVEGEITFDGDETPRFEPKPLDPALNDVLSSAERRKAENEEALRRLNDAMVVSQEKQTELQESVAALDKDKEALVDQLIATAQSIQNLEDELIDTERNLANLADEEKRIRQSLKERRAILSEVMAALQRMGQNPPPAIVINASDALQSVRSAILLGSVLPELKSEADLLVQDLKALNDVKIAVKVEQKELIDQEGQLSEEQLRLDLLIKENQKLRVTSDEKLIEERKNVASLARDATNLRDLVENLSNEITSANNEITSAQAAAIKQAELRRLAYEAQRQREAASLSSLRPEALADEDNAQSSEESIPINTTRPNIPRRVVDYSKISEAGTGALSPDAFEKSKGLLRFPARGTEFTAFGGADGLGGISEGIALATRAKTPVVAPSAGRIVFAGPFPGYEQLLIMDVGGGYHIVLAGMEDINVKIGDSVKAGQPIALMGGERLAKLAGLPIDVSRALDNSFSSSQTQPVLYVEFRKDGKSINSSPWWAKS